MSENVFGPVETTPVAEISSTNAPDGQTETPTESEMSPTEKKMYKLMVDGAEEEVDEDTLIKHAQKYKAADKKFNESAQLRKQSEQLLTMLKENPFAVLTQLGLDPTEIAKEHLTRELQNMRMSPEERELAELRAERDARLKASREEEERLANEKELAARNELASNMEKQIISALDSVNLPKDESSVRMMVEIMKHAVAGDVEISWQEAAEMVKENHKKNYAHFFSQLNEDELAALLGDDVVKKLVKRSTKNLYKEELPKEQLKKVVSSGRKTIWDQD